MKLILPMMSLVGAAMLLFSGVGSWSLGYL
jgi:hypothetical protein